MQPEWVLLALLLLLPAAIIAVSIVYSVIACRPQIDDSLQGDLMILAAHPDDCAIVAGELAQEVINAGSSVRVVYMTCGSKDASDERARSRRAEAIAAWSVIGVGEANLTFLDFPHTDENAGSRFTPEMAGQAGSRILPILRSLSRGTTVLIPAPGETHVDHRTLRAVGLGALRSAGRDDLRLAESPEYNPYLSLVRSPARSLMYLVASLPMVSRIVDRTRFVPPPSFFAGSPGLVLAPDTERLEIKRRMLRCFRSENHNDVLVKLFVFPDHYRRVSLDEAERRADERWFLRIGERFLSPGLIAWWLTLWSAMLVGLYIAGRQKARWLGDQEWAGGRLVAVAITAAVGSALLTWAVLKRRSLEQRVTIFVAGMGLIAGGLATEEVLLSFLLGD